MQAYKHRRACTVNDNPFQYSRRAKGVYITLDIDNFCALCSFWVTASAYISSRATRSEKPGPSIRLTTTHPFRFVQYCCRSSTFLLHTYLSGGLERAIDVTGCVLAVKVSPGREAGIAEARYSICGDSCGGEGRENNAGNLLIQWLRP